jgi:23S rRNA (uracil1939-C5)-methyltransferase
LTRPPASRFGGQARNRAVRFGNGASGAAARQVGGQVTDVDIEELAPDGDGIAIFGGRRLIVPFTIPGERVRVRIAERPRGRSVGSLLEILRPSPHRVAPRCRHFGADAMPGIGACGGCTWQHITYPEQLRLKALIVDRLVRAVVPDAPNALPTLAGTALEHPWGYRHKVHFVFGNRGSILTMGHYVRGSRRIIPVAECPVHDERGNAFAFATRDTFAAAGVRAADGERGTLRSLAVRVGHRTRELMVTLIVWSDRDRRVRAATRRLLERTQPTSLHLNVHDRDDPFIFGATTRRLFGAARMREEVVGASFLMSPAAFFQTNVEAADILVRLVLAAMSREARVLDLFAGSGLFAIPLAAAGHEVIAVEENRLAVGDGEAALKLNDSARSRCRFVQRRVEVALPSFTSIDAMVLDPPREGCSPAVLREVFGRIKPARAVYVSCNPEALAAELGPICAKGYRIVSLQPVDMFPHTAHIETVAVLERTSNRSKSLKGRQEPGI